MAERLTGKSKGGFYLKDDFGGRIYCDDDKETINAYYGQPLIFKLGKLEDILEKYGIRSMEELEVKLNFQKKLIKKAQQELAEIYIKDRDTWQKACELACEWFKQTGFIGDQTKVDYFYQQAKKEGDLI